MILQVHLMQYFQHSSLSLSRSRDVKHHLQDTCSLKVAT